MTKLYILVSCSAFILFGCSSKNAGPNQNFHQIPITHEPSQENIPSPSLFSHPHKEKLQKFQRLNELMIPDKIIKLEVTDDSVIGSIYDLVYTPGYWIILDTIQHKVMKFSSEGAFLGLIGRPGKGPGEYVQPDSIELCYEQNIAVYDGALGCIHVYDINGAHQFTTNLSSDKIRIHARSTFIWESKYRLYLFGFPSENSDAPWHVLVDPFAEPSPFEVIVGFGKRFEPYRDKGLGTWSFSAVAVVDDKLWTGSPYSNLIDVFDFEGRSVGQLGHKGDPNAPRADDHDLKNHKQILALRQQKNFNFKLCTVGPIVLSFLFMNVDVYDHQGNFLTPPLKAGKISFPLTTFSEKSNHYMVTPFHILEKKGEYTSGEIELMILAGYDLESLSNENTGLFISKLDL